MNKISEIFKAWVAAANPTAEQAEIAEKRLAICNECEFSRYNKALDFHYCGECGCPLNKKIFSPAPGKEACPKAKWDV